MITEIAEKVTSGDVNPLAAYIELKKIEDELKQAMSIVQPLAIDEADKFSEKSFKFQGAIIEKRSSPATYDFSGVLAYQQAKERIKYIETIAKAGGGADEHGEWIDKAHIIKGKATIAVKLVK